MRWRQRRLRRSGVLIFGGLAVIGLSMIVAAIINTLAGKGGDDE
jgi:hypothetical protein